MDWFSIPGMLVLTHIPFIIVVTYAVLSVRRTRQAAEALARAVEKRGSLDP